MLELQSVFYIKIVVDYFMLPNCFIGINLIL